VIDLEKGWEEWKGWVLRIEDVRPLERSIGKSGTGVERM
jgi:hypothetical protein